MFQGDGAIAAENALVDDVKIRLDMEGTPTGDRDSSLASSLQQVMQGVPTLCGALALTSHWF